MTSSTPSNPDTPAPETGGTGTGQREITLQRTSAGSYEIINVRGGRMQIGDGNNADFTPVELLLAAIAGCSSVDVDYITSRRAEPESFTVHSSGVKTRSPELGNLLEQIAVTFDVNFPSGSPGDAARAALPRAIQQSHDRLCTVSRTVQVGTPITMAEGTLAP